MKEKLREVCDYPNGRTLSRECNELYRFYHEIDVGDVIMARRGTKRIVGVGTVTRKAYYDEEDNNGEEYRIFGDDSGLIGRIAILAREPTSNSLVVIELKRGRESYRVVGQLLSYMGWIKDNLCVEDQDVKGVILCKSGSTLLGYTLRMVKSAIDVYYYNVDIELQKQL